MNLSKIINFKNVKTEKEYSQMLKSEKKKAREQAKRETRKLKQIKEKEIEKNKRNSKKVKEIAAPSSVASSIKYQKMFDNGICNIDGEYYSKTIAFADINYQIAKIEEQKSIFGRYCEFLNYFNADVHVQITLQNRYLNEIDFKKETFIPLKDPNTENADIYNEYIEEYNKMLEEKTQEGQNNIIRFKYITFSTFASSYKDAVLKLSRIETEIMNNFKALGCETRVLEGLERLQIMNDTMNPDDPLTFSYSYLFGSGKTTKDYIVPYCFDFSKKSTFECGDYYSQVVILRDYGSDASDELLKDLAALPFSLDINIHLDAMDRTEAMNFVKQKLAFMQQQKVDEQRKAHQAGYDDTMIPEDLKYSMDEAEELLHNMQHKNQNLFKTTILVYTCGKTEDELESNIEQIKSAGRKYAVKFTALAYQQEDALNSTLIIGKNFISSKRTLPSATAAAFIPFLTQELYQKHGIYYGLNALSHNMILFDMNTLKNQNSFVLGTPGSGKSFATKRSIVNYLLATDAEVLIIDPEREYTKLVEGFKGEILYISQESKTHINPFDVNMNYSDDGNPLSMKADFILSMMDIMCGGKNGVSKKERSIIDRVTNITYNDFFANPEKTPVPTLKEYYKNLKMQPEPEAQGISLALETYVTGNMSAFSHSTNIDIKNRLICFDIKDLGANLTSLGMLIVLDQIWNRVTRNRLIGKKTYVIIDEIYLLFQNDYSAQFLFNSWKRSRKYGCAMQGITQNVEDLLISDTARRMLSNSEFIMMLNQATSDKEELAGLLNISEQQLSYVTMAPAGQGLLYAGNAIIPFIDKFPTNTKLYKMMTTKLEEIVAFENEENKKEDAEIIGLNLLEKKIANE